ncbi:MAG: glutamyl-tRNA amidotransferase [Eubacteriales bacterium]|nr:glutamyl-tRNA amidotransferase [Eubacteriales bacterium]
MENKTILLAVNGTLMRGLELNKNLLEVGATFIREDMTADCYRLWSIDDKHPAMIRTPGEGGSVAVEIWSVPYEGIAKVLLDEPAGLTIGKVLLMDGTMVLGVLGEPFLCQDQLDITEYAGWHSYMAEKTKQNNS